MPRPERQAEDVLRLVELHAEPGRPVRVFGSCVGASVPLRLLQEHPERVDAVVTHDVPPIELLPAPQEMHGFFEEVHLAYARGGVLAGLRRLGERIVPVGGLESREFVVQRPAAQLSRPLGRELLFFPGGYNGYVDDPASFARQLELLLETLPTRAGAVCAAPE
ncbi:hypothetical protein ACFV6F_26745 [Kitasatospora phosalacinea]|uniref:hypothetical protein n=1 Tax=Kitasatospora phosalacinea TaxID=2065 RepID=UPI0036470E34